MSLSVFVNRKIGALASHRSATLISMRVMCLLIVLFQRLLEVYPGLYLNHRAPLGPHSLLTTTL